MNDENMMNLANIDVYEKAVVYMIYCKNTEVKDIYIGSTIRGIKDRIYSHKTVCHNANDKRYNTPLYVYIRKNGGWKNWQYKILASCQIYTKKALYAIERQYIKDLKPKLNIYIPNRTRREHYIDNIDKIKLWHKEYDKKRYQLKKAKMTINKVNTKQEVNTIQEVNTKQEIKQDTQKFKIIIIA